MAYSTEEIFARALAAESPLSRRELHALLYGYCNEDGRRGRLRDLLHRPEWEAVAADVQYRAFKHLEASPWVADTLRALAGMVDDADRLLCNAAALLQTLDRHHRDRRPLVEYTQVRLPFPGAGEALFLPPPKAPWEALIPEARQLRRGEEDYGHPLRPLLGLFWSVVPQGGRRLEVVPVGVRTEGILSGRFERRRDLRIALAAPFAELAYAIEGAAHRCHAQDGTPFRFLGLRPDCRPAACASVTSLLAQCAEHEVDLLCFPELSLDGELLQHLRDRLRLHNPSHYPALVVAGSFHFDTAEGRFNQCAVLDGVGTVLLVQEKQASYRILAEQARALSAEQLALLQIDARGGYEDVRFGGTLRLLESPVGRIATPICLDFIGEELRDLFFASRANLFLVPALTAEMRPFGERARKLGDYNRAMTFVANSAWGLRTFGIAPEPETLSHVYLPARKKLDPARPAGAGELAVLSIRDLLELP